MARVKTPILLQLEAAECGAACLGSILEYFGKIVPLTELRRECGVSRDGVKASNMLKAARRYGLQAKGYKETLETAQNIPFPYVAFWNFNHFLIVEGFDNKRNTVFLNDPAHGHRKVTLEEFDESFTGVVLRLSPGEGFQAGGSRPSFTGAIIKRFVHAREGIKFLLVSALLLTIPGLILPAFTRIYLDDVIGERRLDWLSPLLLAMCATIIFRLIVDIFKYQCLRRLQMHLGVTMSSQFFWHLLRLPMTFYAQRYSGEIASRQELNGGIVALLSGRLADTALNIIMMFFYGLLMFYYNWFLTLIGFAFAAISFFALRLLGKRRSEANIRLRQDFGKVSADTIAALQSMETLKSSGQESSFFTRWAGRYAKAVNSLTELEISTQQLSVLPLLFNGLNTTLIYLFGGLAVINGDMSIGTLVAFVALMSSFQAPISSLVMLGGEIQELDGDLKRLDDVLEAPIDPEALDERLQDLRITRSWPLQLSGKVDLKNISFGYSPLEPPLFANISISIEPGQRVAFVGASGSGKTTLGYLVSGLYQPWGGEVLFDGCSRAEIPRSVMVSSFAVVSQDIFLFEGTVRENLTLWDPTIADEALLNACRDAVILDTVLALPGGLDGRLLEAGANLSGGQRQRLEIARALVQNPAIIVLDEATSALDAETERMIDERLRLRGCTCIIVAHRLSTIRDCDEIIVLEHGDIKERGDHASLMKLEGAYAMLIRAGDATGM